LFRATGREEGAAGRETAGLGQPTDGGWLLLLRLLLRGQGRRRGLVRALSYLLREGLDGLAPRQRRPAAPSAATAAGPDAAGEGQLLLVVVVLLLVLGGGGGQHGCGRRAHPGGAAGTLAKGKYAWRAQAREASVRAQEHDCLRRNESARAADFTFWGRGNCAPPPPPPPPLLPPLPPPPPPPPPWPLPLASSRCAWLLVRARPMLGMLQPLRGFLLSSRFRLSISLM
jgi:hypothetical protein